MEIIFFYIIGAYVICGGYFAPKAIENARNLNDFLAFIGLTLLSPITLLIGLGLVLKPKKLLFFDNY